MNRPRFFIRGIDDYERSLKALGLDSSESAGSSDSSGSDVDNEWMLLTICDHQILLFRTVVTCQVVLYSGPNTGKTLRP